MAIRKIEYITIFSILYAAIHDDAKIASREGWGRGRRRDKEVKRGRKERSDEGGFGDYHPKGMKFLHE